MSNNPADADSTVTYGLHFHRMNPERVMNLSIKLLGVKFRGNIFPLWIKA